MKEVYYYCDLCGKRLDISPSDVVAVLVSINTCIINRGEHEAVSNREFDFCKDCHKKFDDHIKLLSACCKQY